MKILNTILSVIIILLYSYLTYLLYDIGLLSSLLGIIGFIFLTVILLLIIIGMFKLKKKIIAYVFYILMTFVMFIGIYYLNTTKNFIDSFDKSDKENFDNYYVVVLKSSKYTKLSDLNSKKIGVCEKLGSNVTKKININYSEENYTSCQLLKEALFQNRVDAMIINDVNEYLLSDTDDDFEKKIRIIYKISIPKKTKKVNKNDNVDVTNTPFTFFISGIDTSGAISTVSRSDVNIVVTVNPKTYEVLLTTIPRDYYVRLHGTTGYKDKLTHAGIYGIDKSVSTVEDLLKINLNYYVRVNFDSVTKLVDELGGISIYSDKALNFCNIKKGYNYLDGKCALRFARERHSYDSGDRHRGENQEEVIKAIINKVSSSSTILTKYSSILSNLQDSFETDVSSDTIKKLINLQASDMPKWNVKTLNLNGYDSHNYTYSYNSGSMLYVMEPDVNTVNKASRVINGMLKGKTFNKLGL